MKDNHIITYMKRNIYIYLIITTAGWIPIAAQAQGVFSTPSSTEGARVDDVAPTGSSSSSSSSESDNFFAFFSETDNDSELKSSILRGFDDSEDPGGGPGGNPGSGEPVGEGLLFLSLLAGLYGGVMRKRKHTK